MADVERALVEAAQGGDDEALAELVRRTHGGVYTLAFRLVGDPDDAADVTQEVYLRVVRKLKGFRHEASIRTWLHRVTTNVALSLLSSRRRRLAFESGPPSEAEQDPAPGPAERAEAAALARRLEALVAGLPEGQRKVLVLRDVYGLTTEEVASAMQLTTGATKVRLFRARERLKAQLEADRGQVVALARHRARRRA